MNPLEKEVEARLRQRVIRMGGKLFKFTSPGNAGVPDRIAVLPGGKIWFIELKSKTGKPSKLQEWTIRQLKDLGANAIILRGDEEVEQWCNEIQGA